VYDVPVRVSLISSDPPLDAFDSVLLMSTFSREMRRNLRRNRRSARSAAREMYRSARCGDIAVHATNASVERTSFDYC
jgi:hypothetical protein